MLSFEGPLAVRLGYDEALLAKVAEAIARAAMQDMRWSVKERHGLGSVESLHLVGLDLDEIDTGEDGLGLESGDACGEHQVSTSKLR